MLKWKNVHGVNLQAGDDYITLELIPNDLDSSDPEFQVLESIVDGQSNKKLALLHSAICLGFGTNGADWADFWWGIWGLTVSGGVTPFYVVQGGDSFEDEIGYVQKGYLDYLMHYKEQYAHNMGLDWVSTTNSHLPSATYLSPYWGIEGQTVHVRVPLMSHIYQDDDGYWKIDYDVSQRNILLGLDDYEYDLENAASWWKATNMEGQNIQGAAGTYTVKLDDITSEILLNFRLGILSSQPNNANEYTVEIDIACGGYSDNDERFMSFRNFSIDPQPTAPNYDFSLAITNLENLPQGAISGESTSGSFTVESDGNFNGTFTVYAFDHNDNLADFNAMLQTSLDEHDAAQYGTLSYQNTVYSITEGGSVEVPITYTANSNTTQTDSYSIIVVMNAITPSAYGNFSEEAQEQFDNLPQNSKMIYTDIPTIQIYDAAEMPVIYPYTPSDNLITKPVDIMLHIIEQELGYDKSVDYNLLLSSREEHRLDSFKQGMFWDLDFCVNKSIGARKLISEISKSSKSFASLSSDSLRFNTINNTYTGEEENIFKIYEYDVIKYNFSRTPIKDVLTEIEIKYGYDIGLDSFTKSTGKVRVHDGYLKSGIYSNYSNQNYYGLPEDEDGNIEHTDSQLVTENKYIQNDITAKALAHYMLNFRQNQHNIIELTLPLKYFNLENGDLIEFDKMILGKKVYGEKYVLEGWEDMPVRAGQYILPLFMVTETNKSINSVKIKAIQLHHMNYGELVWRGSTYNALHSWNWWQTQGVETPDNVFIGGDINADSYVDILDLVIIINKIVDQEEFTEAQFDQADANQDGYVNVLDIVTIVNQIVNP